MTGGSDMTGGPEVAGARTASAAGLRLLATTTWAGTATACR